MFRVSLQLALSETSLRHGVDYAVVTHVHDGIVSGVTLNWNGSYGVIGVRGVPQNSVELTKFDDDEVTHWAVRLRLELGK